MPSAGIWRSLDYKHPIDLIRRSRPVPDQATGTASIPVETTTAVYGNLILEPMTDEVRSPGGLMERGEARFHTDTLLLPGDILRVWMDDAKTVSEDFSVVAVVEMHTLTNALAGTPDRREYKLLRRHR